MKKTVIILSFLLGAAMTAAAQDTVEFLQAIPGYLYDNTWKANGYKGQYGFTPFGGPSTGGEYAKRFLMDDSVTIYGIAASVVDRKAVMDTEFPYYSHYSYDTSYAGSIEHLRLYRNQADTLACIAQVPIHLRTTPISYYYHINCPSYFLPQRQYAAMYELYFDTAVTVCDSFYAGMTFFIERHYTVDGTQYEFACPPLYMNFLGVSPEDSVSYRYIIAGRHRNADGTYYNNWSSGIEKQTVALLFPILMPPDTVASGTDTVAMGDTLIVTDTVIIGGDTIVNYDTLLAVVQNDLLQRLTAVTPNPAVGTARVVASTGLSRIVAYNTAGSKVYDRPATGLSATLDVSRWPSGTYLLRIHTPLGTVTKKLIVN